MSDRKVSFAPLPVKKKKEEEEKSDSFETDSESDSSKRERERKRVEEIEKSQKEWEEVEKLQNECKNSLPTENGVGGTKIDYSTSITYFDARISLVEDSSKIDCKIPEINYVSRSCFCMRIKPASFVLEAFSEMYKVAKVQFDENSLDHFRILSSLHMAITGILSPPPRFGQNWIDIGFQTEDPIKDLRGTGMLGLLLPLGLFAKFKVLGSRLIRLSRGENPFPLMLIIIVYVSETLNAAKSTDLLKNVKSKDEVWNNVLLYLAGLTNILSKEWEDEFLDFQHDYDRFNQIPNRYLTNVEAVLKSGKNAEKEDEKNVASSLVNNVC